VTPADFVLDAAEQVRAAMRAKGVSSRELARRLAMSEARVSQMLNAHPNLTLHTLGRVFTALELEPVLAWRAPQPSEKTPL
jgi:transcriptional regulator with XRE-family HTH domain